MPRKKSVPVKQNGEPKLDLTVPDEKSEVAPIGDMFADVEGQGFETVEARDLLVPRLVIAQKLSPQLNKSNPNFIEGASEGDICETGIGNHYQSVNFLPVVYRKVWIEWAPRKEARGIVQIHETDKVLKSCTIEDGRYFLNRNPVVETAQFFGFLIKDNGDLERCFISMTSTQLRKARRWLHIASSVKLSRSDGSRFRAPLWYHAYNLSSAEESNEQGSWYGWTVQINVDLPELAEGLEVSTADLIDECKSLHAVVTQGQAQGNYGDEEAPNTSPRRTEPDDEEIPF